MGYADLKLISKKKLCESFSDWRPITLMPVIYKLIAKIISNRIKDTLLGCIHVNQNGFIPRRQIRDNIANAYIGMEYAKYTKQDVLLMQIDHPMGFCGSHNGQTRIWSENVSSNLLALWV